MDRIVYADIAYEREPIGPERFPDDPTPHYEATHNERLTGIIRADIKRAIDSATNYGLHTIDQSLREEIIEGVVDFWTAVDGQASKEEINWKEEGF